MGGKIMFTLDEKDLKVLNERTETLKPLYSGDEEMQCCSDCGDCEARNASIYCGNR